MASRGATGPRRIVSPGETGTGPANPDRIGREARSGVAAGTYGQPVSGTPERQQVGDDPGSLAQDQGGMLRRNFGTLDLLDDGDDWPGWQYDGLLPPPGVAPCPPPGGRGRLDL